MSLYALHWINMWGEMSVNECVWGENGLERKRVEKISTHTGKSQETGTPQGEIDRVLGPVGGSASGMRKLSRIKCTTMRNWIVQKEILFSLKYEWSCWWGMAWSCCCWNGDEVRVLRKEGDMVVVLLDWEFWACCQRLGALLNSPSHIFTFSPHFWLIHPTNWTILWCPLRGNCVEWYTNETSREFFLFVLLLLCPLTHWQHTTMSTPLSLSNPFSPYSLPFPPICCLFPISTIGINFDKSRYFNLQPQPMPHQ